MSRVGPQRHGGRKKLMTVMSIKGFGLKFRVHYKETYKGFVKQLLRNDKFIPKIT